MRANQLTPNEIKALLIKTINSAIDAGSFAKAYSKAKDPALFINVVEACYKEYGKEKINQGLANVLPILGRELDGRNPKLFVDLKLLYLGHQEDAHDKIVDFLASDPDYTDCVIAHFKALDEKDQEKMFKDLVVMAVNKYNATLLDALKKMDPKGHETIIRTLPEDRVKLIDQVQKEYRKEFSSYMKQFVNGFGNIDYEGALLTCAQFRDRKADPDRRNPKRPEFTSKQKTYDVDVVVLNPKGQLDEYEEFMKAMKDADPPVRKKFILADTHWCIGEIKINEKGEAHLIVFDSLGKESNMFPEEFINCFYETFQQNEEDKHEEEQVHFSGPKRQHSRLGCSVIVLGEDLPYFYTVENYIEQHDLFEYAEEQLKRKKATEVLGQKQEQTEEENSIVSSSYQFTDHRIQHGSKKMHAFDIPIGFLRIKQSSSLFKEIIPQHPEKNNIVNKYGETAMEGVILNEKEQNVRAEKKLERMAEENAKFFVANQGDGLKDKMQHFTFDAFQAQMEEQKNQKPINSGKVLKTL